MKRQYIFILLVIACLALLVYGGYYQYSHAIQIRRISLSSPENSALKEDIRIGLNKAASVYIEYWKKGSHQKFRTPSTNPKRDHLIHLLLLEPGSTYHYRVVIDRIFPVKSLVKTFRTRKPSPWMVHDWIKDYHPRDAKALGNGLALLCYRGYPGYIAMVDGNGTIRWYWQDPKLGVRIATITPRGTILALLAPATKDEFNKPKKNGGKTGDIKNYYLRTGKIGFVGGTEIVEIDLTGKVLWRANLEKKGLIMHHDLRMDQAGNVVGIIRDAKLLPKHKAAPDTLWGDAVVVLDTTGKVLRKWSAWDHWDVAHDKKLDSLKHDRFHLNTISFDRDSNYLVSSPIENQVWKVDAQTGKLLWKLGKGGDFQMDTATYFYFQHAAHKTEDGDLLIFDNGDFSPTDTTNQFKQSRAISFSLDTVNKVAEAKIIAPLPVKFYTARMGSAYLLPNGNLLQTSSKTGGVLVTNQQGKLLWELDTYFIPYRTEYVDEGIWNNYFKVD